MVHLRTNERMDIDSKTKITGIVVVEDNGRHLRASTLALRRWVSDILILCRKTDPGIFAIAEEFGCSVVIHDSSDVLEMWETGIKKSSTLWRLLLRANEVVTGQLRHSINEATKVLRNDSCAYPLPLVTVFLKKRLKYPLAWSGSPSSRLVHIAPNAIAGLNSISVENRRLDGELISYGDETLTECITRSLARAEIRAGNLYRRNPFLSPLSLVWTAAFSVIRDFIVTYFLKKGFKEGFEGLVFTLAEQAVSVRTCLRYYEEYIRGGRQMVARGVRRILVVKLRDIGDNILATPLCKNIKQQFPDASLSVLSWSYSLPVFENNPCIDQLYGLSKNAGPEEAEALIKQLNARDFDLIMNLHAGGFSSRLIGKIKARCRINNYYVGRDKESDILVPASDYYRSSIERDLDCLRSLGKETVPVKPEIFLTSGEIEWARDYLIDRGFDLERKIIVVHPTASVEVREWGMERFGPLIAKIKTEHDQVMVICTDAEYPRVKELIRHVPDLAVFHQLTVRQMMALIHESDLVIDNDSAPSHVATAFHIPTVVLFSQAIREIFRPYDPEKDRHWVLYRDVPCRECKLDYCSHKTCLDFTVDEVYEKSMEMIAGSQ